MIPVIGIVVVIGCIAGGYLIEKGNLLVLMQPAELLIIGGAAHHQGRLSASALTTVADSLPGLGIVAAVLGVVITMGTMWQGINAAINSPAPPFSAYDDEIAQRRRGRKDVHLLVATRGQ